MTIIKHSPKVNNNYGDRITRVEVITENINITMNRIDYRLDSIDKNIDRLREFIDDKAEKLNARIWSNFLWLLSTMILFSGILLGVMAKGFHFFG